VPPPAEELAPAEGLAPAAGELLPAPPPAELPAALPPELAGAAEDDPPPEAEGAELPADGADEAADVVLLLVPGAAGVLLPPHAVMTSANAPIPAMVVIALLVDVRVTRPTSVSRGKSCEGAHNRSNENVCSGEWQVHTRHLAVTIS